MRTTATWRSNSSQSIRVSISKSASRSPVAIHAASFSSPVPSSLQVRCSLCWLYDLLVFLETVWHLPISSPSDAAQYLETRLPLKSDSEDYIRFADTESLPLPITLPTDITNFTNCLANRDKGTRCAGIVGFVWLVLSSPSDFSYPHLHLEFDSRNLMLRLLRHVPSGSKCTAQLRGRDDAKFEDVGSFEIWRFEFGVAIECHGEIPHRCVRRKNKMNELKWIATTRKFVWFRSLQSIRSLHLIDWSRTQCSDVPLESQTISNTE